MKKHIIGAALASLLALPALAQNIAIVNGKAIPTSRADALKKQVEASGQAVTPEIMAKIKDELITREIFMQEAKSALWTPLTSTKTSSNWPAKAS